MPTLESDVMSDGFCVRCTEDLPTYASALQMRWANVEEMGVAPLYSADVNPDCYYENLASNQVRFNPNFIDILTLS